MSAAEGARSLHVLDGNQVRVALMPVGRISPERFERYARVLTDVRSIDVRVVDRTEVSSASSHAFPFSEGLADYGQLRILFVDVGYSNSPWDSLQASRQVLAVVGICYCPEADDFLSAWESFLHDVQSSHVWRGAISVHCIAIEPGEHREILAGGLVGKTLHFVNDEEFDGEGKEREVPQGIMEVLRTVGSELLHGLEQRVVSAEAQLPWLITPNDGGDARDKKVMQKRGPGRVCKRQADLSFLAGCNRDAAIRYFHAIELSRSRGDLLGQAAALEGFAGLSTSFPSMHGRPRHGSLFNGSDPKAVPSVGVSSVSSGNLGRMSGTDREREDGGDEVGDMLLEAASLYEKRRAYYLQCQALLRFAHYVACGRTLDGLDSDSFSELDEAPEATCPRVLPWGGRSEVFAIAVLGCMALLAFDMQCYRKFSYFVWKISHCHSASNSWHLALDSLLIAAPFCVVLGAVCRGVQLQVAPMVVVAEEEEGKREGEGSASRGEEEEEQLVECCIDALKFRVWNVVTQVPLLSERSERGRKTPEAGIAFAVIQQLPQLHISGPDLSGVALAGEVTTGVLFLENVGGAPVEVLEVNTKGLRVNEEALKASLPLNRGKAVRIDYWASAEAPGRGGRRSSNAFSRLEEEGNAGGEEQEVEVQILYARKRERSFWRRLVWKTTRAVEPSVEISNARIRECWAADAHLEEKTMIMEACSRADEPLDEHHKLSDVIPRFVASSINLPPPAFTTCLVEASLEQQGCQAALLKLDVVNHSNLLLSLLVTVLPQLCVSFGGDADGASSKTFSLLPRSVKRVALLIKKFETPAEEAGKDDVPPLGQRVRRPANLSRGAVTGSRMRDVLFSHLRISWSSSGSRHGLVNLLGMQLEAADVSCLRPAKVWFHASFASETAASSGVAAPERETAFSLIEIRRGGWSDSSSLARLHDPPDGVLVAGALSCTLKANGDTSPAAVHQLGICFLEAGSYTLLASCYDKDGSVVAQLGLALGSELGAVRREELEGETGQDQSAIRVESHWRGLVDGREAAMTSGEGGGSEKLVSLIKALKECVEKELLMGETILSHELVLKDQEESVRRLEQSFADQKDRMRRLCSYLHEKQTLAADCLQEQLDGVQTVVYTRRGEEEKHLNMESQAGAARLVRLVLLVLCLLFLFLAVAHACMEGLSVGDAAAGFRYEALLLWGGRVVEGVLTPVLFAQLAASFLRSRKICHAGWVAELETLARWARCLLFFCAAVTCLSNLQVCSVLRREGLHRRMMVGYRELVCGGGGFIDPWGAIDTFLTSLLLLLLLSIHWSFSSSSSSVLLFFVVASCALRCAATASMCSDSVWTEGTRSRVANWLLVGSYVAHMGMCVCVLLLQGSPHFRRAVEKEEEASCMKKQLARNVYLKEAVEAQDPPLIARRRRFELDRMLESDEPSRTSRGGAGAEDSLSLVLAELGMDEGGGGGGGCARGVREKMNEKMKGRMEDVDGNSEEAQVPQIRPTGDEARGEGGGGRGGDRKNRFDRILTRDVTAGGLTSVRSLLSQSVDTVLNLAMDLHELRSQDSPTAAPAAPSQPEGTKTKEEEREEEKEGEELPPRPSSPQLVSSSVQEDTLLSELDSEDRNVSSSRELNPHRILFSSRRDGQRRLDRVAPRPPDQDRLLPGISQEEEEDEGGGRGRRGEEVLSPAGKILVLKLGGGKEEAVGLQEQMEDELAACAGTAGKEMKMMYEAPRLPETCSFLRLHHPSWRGREEVEEIRAVLVRCIMEGTFLRACSQVQIKAEDGQWVTLKHESAHVLTMGGALDWSLETPHKASETPPAADPNGGEGGGGANRSC
ncbi:trafficking protein particle complex 9 [Guillardia theta CCMP2712]|uniref:Trafficking protein particle complex 9 n=1 Tax=Guillardia theta (strain CCMP2712) TaxID=905079 RepID=L1I834_GUITC|nr:trafficking protein particle complex 9 [Guillardia theta CCMP2712]EKX32378.1 trafficking protein particle complex 9 [Guillardia theta CCMP2712]|eukprot:XP_005819358.1 trafficking protein particle complex 9 [Guillardia theta CCMP2712]